MKKLILFLCFTLCITGSAFAALPDDATLAWGPVTTNTDGSPLTDLGGYKVYCGTATGIYSTVQDVGNVETFKVSSILPGSGSYFCTVAAYNTQGTVGPYSNEVSFQIIRRPGGCTLSVK